MCSRNDVIMSGLSLTATSTCFPHPYQTYTNYLSTLTCCPLAYVSSLTQPSIWLGSDCGALGLLCGVEMMSLRHGWGWQPPQTASHIHIKHIQNIWALWLVVHGHLLAALHSCLTWLWFVGSGSGSLLWSQNDVIMSWLWGCQPPQTASHIHIRHIHSVWAHWYLSIGIHYQPYTVIPLTNLGQMLGFCVTYVESKWCHCAMVEVDSHLKLLPPSILHINKAFEHIDIISISYCPWAYVSSLTQ